MNRNMGLSPQMVVQTSIGGFALRKAADLPFSALGPARPVYRVQYHFRGGIDGALRDTLGAVDRLAANAGHFLPQPLAGGTNQTFFRRRARQHEGDGGSRQEA
jgi:hypothetical protein